MSLTHNPGTKIFCREPNRARWDHPAIAMNGYKPENPLIVQGDHTILAEVASPQYAAARDGLSRFAELVKAPEHVHTYRVTPLSIWNACTAGVTSEEIAGTLGAFSKYPVAAWCSR